MVLAICAVAWLAPSVANAHFNSSQFTYGECGSRKKVDPINVVFYGYLALPSQAAKAMEKYGGWTHKDGSSQLIYSHGSCTPMGTQRADGSDIWTSNRVHMRFFQNTDLDNKQRWESSGDAHIDAKSASQACKNHPPANNDSFYKGGGYNFARYWVLDILWTKLDVKELYYGNTAKRKTCGGGYVWSDGNVLWALINKPIA
jgi:hypothetical protein